MSKLSRRDLARISAWLVAGAAVGVRPGTARERQLVDPVSGVRLLHRILGEDLATAVRTARWVGNEQLEDRARLVFAAAPAARIVADLTPTTYRFTVSSAAGSVTVAGTPDRVGRIVARPARRRDGGAYDTAILEADGIRLTSSSGLAQRHLPARFVAGARRPAVYDDLAWLLARRIRTAGRR